MLPHYQHANDRTVGPGFDLSSVNAGRFSDASPSMGYQCPMSSDRQRVQRPKSHPNQLSLRPSHVHASYGEPSAYSIPQNDNRRPVAHMLRRKTPSGTLPAGYDAGTMHWSAEAHASKHILMLPGSGSTLRAVPAQYGFSQACLGAEFRHFPRITTNAAGEAYHPRVDAALHANPALPSCSYRPSGPHISSNVDRQKPEEAELLLLQCVKIRPSYFEAVERLVTLLCHENRTREAVGIIDYVQQALRCDNTAVSNNSVSDLERRAFDHGPESKRSEQTPLQSNMVESKMGNLHNFSPPLQDPQFGSSGYSISAETNGRLLALVHAKGNLLYALGDVNAAASAFGEAVLIAVGCGVKSIDRLISQILTVWSTGCSKEHQTSPSIVSHNTTPTLAHHPSTLVLLSPENALQTVRRMFPQHEQLPGLRHVPRTYMRSAVSTVSNSLLSLAKIFQDGMNAGSQPRVCGTAEILGLYYLSLALQPSPSTANNVGILLASIPQQPCHDDAVHRADPSIPMVPGIKPGSGVALALAYYNYGLNLDPRHAHLYTNLGSLLKDIGQLAAAVKMYEQAVTSDPFFDIALANLANAVKDQGRVGDAIVYYKRAVAASPNFAEAVCGLANALNSVCSWNGRGGVIFENARHDRWHVMEDGMLQDAHIVKSPSGWMQRVADIVLKQLRDGSSWGCGTLSPLVLMTLLRELEVADTATHWPVTEYESMRARLQSWYGRPWEGARVVRLIERAIRRAMHRRYRDKYIHMRELPAASYCRPHIPQSLSVPSAPTVLPFHTFTCPLDARAIREIAERNALRISCATLKTSWLPETVYPPPPPPMPHLNVGYVSSDFNNHPLAHLMQSVFGLHNPSRVKAFCYATTPDDHSVHRRQIEKEAPVFRDVSSWAPAKVIDQIIADQIHILVNLNGYTRGAKNEIFAARPVPIQMSFMGFAGSLGAEWCDYLLADSTTVPPRTLRPWRRDIDLEDHACYENAENDRDWVYSENIIVCRDTFFCCDHRQAEPNHGDSWRQEERRRRKMRRKLFPNLPQNAIILANFNQLYKIEPTTFRTWLRILSQLPLAFLWLLRFPELGEANLRSTAKLWAGKQVASRILFTDVAPKHQHITRACVADLFLDTPECNAHTTAADVLWSSTPLLTLPRYEYKMCSRMAASILKGALPRSAEGAAAAAELIAKDEDEYEEFAVRLARGLTFDERGFARGRLIDIRRLLYENRYTSALFDTRRWVRDLEEGFEQAWLLWVDGRGGDIYL